MTEDSADPFDELEPSAEEGADFEELFAESAVDDIDSDSLWEELDTGSATMSVEDDEPAAPAKISVVPKRAFCQECPHADEPPAVTCTHEGTEILDFPDMDHVRVRNCPIVEKRGGVMTAEEAGLLD